MTSKYTAIEVAEWMREQFNETYYLEQEIAVYTIAEKFGKEFTYDNENGNPAIRKDVLAAFRKLTKKTVIWERDDLRWRKREAGDEKGRQQG
ncbi:MAG: hypothetical protein WAK48_09905 [Candidatus Acidiferrum sp.]|jgi:hypothetical protein